MNNSEKFFIDRVKSVQPVFRTHPENILLILVNDGYIVVGDSICFNRIGAVSRYIPFELIQL